MGAQTATPRPRTASAPRIARHSRPRAAAAAAAASRQRRVPWRRSKARATRPEVVTHTHARVASPAAA
eukprot:4611951-Prymnesium_polylepis.1